MGKYRDLLISAKDNNSEAVMELYKRCQPTIKKYSYVNGKFDEDLYQIDYYLLICYRCLSIWRIRILSGLQKSTMLSWMIIDRKFFYDLYTFKNNGKMWIGNRFLFPTMKPIYQFYIVATI